MEPGTLPPAVSSRSAGAAPSRFSVPAKTPSSRRSPAPGSPTAPAAPAGSPPRQRSLPAAFSKPFSFVSRLLSASPPRTAIGDSSPVPVPAWVKRGSVLVPGAVSPADGRAGGSGNRGLFPLRGHAWLWGSANPRGSAEATGQRRLLGRELRSPSRHLRDGASRLHRGHQERRCGAHSQFPGLRPPRGHGARPLTAPHGPAAPPQSLSRKPQEAERGGGGIGPAPLGSTTGPPSPLPTSGSCARPPFPFPVPRDSLRGILGLQNPVRCVHAS